MLSKGRKFVGFLLQLTLGNCGVSGATLAWVERTAAVEVLARLQATRDTRRARGAKTVVVLKHFILAR